MIAWSIEAAHKSNCFDKVIVSTDDSEIAEVAKYYGAEVPFVRPEALSDDYAGTISVIKHAIESMSDYSYDFVCCLYATAPFIYSTDLKEGLKKLHSTDLDYVFSVASYASPIQRALKLNALGLIEMFDHEKFNTRSQDLEEAYHDAGQFYWGRAEAWLQGRQIFTSRSSPVILPNYRVHDIDTTDDWLRAEIMFRALNTEFDVGI